MTFFVFFFFLGVAVSCGDVDAVACQGDVLTFCRDGVEVSKEMCRAKEQGATQACHIHQDPPFPDSCGLNSKILSFGDMNQQRAGHWRCENCGEDASKRQKATLDFEDTSVFYETRLALDPHDHSDDLILFNFTDAQSFDLDPSVRIHGVKVHVMVKSMVEFDIVQPGSDTPPANVFCYLTDVELRDDREVSGNRGSDEVTPKQRIPDKWTSQTFGGRLDVWDVFSAPHKFKSTLELEIDFKAGYFIPKTDEEKKAPGSTDDLKYVHNLPDEGEATNTVKCAIASASIEVLYSRPVTTEKIKSGDLLVAGPQGTEWVSYDKRDSEGHVIAKQPENDAAGRKWNHPEYMPSGEDAFSVAWKSGKGPFGYGSDVEATTKVSSHLFTGYFRSELNVDFNPECVVGLELTTTVDDGAIIYLNGQEMWWMNMDPQHFGPPEYDTPALRKVFHENDAKVIYLPSAVLLLPGRNVFTAEVHQVHPDSSDLVFDLGLRVFYLEKDECATKVTVVAPDAHVDKPVQHSGVPHALGVPVVPGDENLGPETAPEGEESRSWMSIVIALLLFGLLAFVAHTAWTKYGAKHAGSRTFSTSGIHFVNMVDEVDHHDVVAAESARSPSHFGTEAELQRSDYGKPEVKKGAFTTDDWSDF